jgi:ribonuclease HI
MKKYLIIRVTLVKMSEYFYIKKLSDDGKKVPHKLFFDGGSAPTNPGPTAGAFVIYRPSSGEAILFKGGKYIEHSTNNVGEYTGLLTGLERCVHEGIKNVLIHGDSSLVINQISGKWKVKCEHLKVLHSECMRLISLLDEVGCKWIPRKLNSEADSMSDEIIKDGSNK